MSVATYDVDLFSEEVLTDPYEHYRALRDAESVLWFGAGGVCRRSL